MIVDSQTMNPHSKQRIFNGMWKIWSQSIIFHIQGLIWSCGFMASKKGLNYNHYSLEDLVDNEKYAYHFLIRRAGGLHRQLNILSRA